MPAPIPSSPSDLRECSAGRASNLPPLLHALWHEAHGDWERAHAITQDLEDADAAWVHAYLHRKEGDTFNAGYWYRRAGRSAFTGSLHAEWTALATHLLSCEGPLSRQAAAVTPVPAVRNEAAFGMRSPDSRATGLGMRPSDSKDGRAV